MKGTPMPKCLLILGGQFSVQLKSPKTENGPWARLLSLLQASGHISGPTSSSDVGRASEQALLKQMEMPGLTHCTQGSLGVELRTLWEELLSSGWIPAWFASPQPCKAISLLRPWGAYVWQALFSETPSSRETESCQLSVFPFSALQSTHRVSP